MERQFPFARLQDPVRSRRRSALGVAGWLAGGLAAAAMLGLPGARAAAPCSAEMNRAVFEVEALKSELMVLAINCHEQDRYNAFVLRYRPELANTDHALQRYFHTTFGRKAQREHDVYITSLANAHSQLAHAVGADFCPRNGAMFQEVMALRSASDLPAFAAGQDLVPPDLGVCDAAPAPVRHVRHVRARRRHAR